MSQMNLNLSLKYYDEYNSDLLDTGNESQVKISTETSRNKFLEAFKTLGKIR
jgi:hypothetical protein